jgi:hypothetical protein
MTRIGFIHPSYQLLNHLQLSPELPIFFPQSIVYSPSATLTMADKPRVCLAYSGMAFPLLNAQLRSFVANQETF